MQKKSAILTGHLQFWMLDDPNLQYVVKFLAIYVYHPNHVHNCAYGPKIMLYEDLRTAQSKKHSINQSQLE